MIEQFHGTPETEIRAAFGTTFTFVDASASMGLVPVVGIVTAHTITLSNPALIRKLIDELSVALVALEATSA